MDILNFISWIRGRRQVTSVDPAKTLIPVGLKDGRRDDEYLTGAISVEDLAAQIAPPTPEPTYKVYTALLTQSGGDDLISVGQDENIFVGITYYIENNDANFNFIPYGAPNNNVGTYFVCTQDAYINTFDLLNLQYNTGAPVVTVLENTIGNIWFTYSSVGNYVAFVPIVAEQKQVVFSPTSAYKTNTGELYIIIENNSIDGQVEISTTDGTSGVDGQMTNVPIEIRVYN